MRKDCARGFVREFRARISCEKFRARKLCGKIRARKFVREKFANNKKFLSKTARKKRAVIFFVNFPTPAKNFRRKPRLRTTFLCQSFLSDRFYKSRGIFLRRKKNRDRPRNLRLVMIFPPRKSRSCHAQAARDDISTKFQSEKRSKAAILRIRLRVFRVSNSP